MLLLIAAEPDAIFAFFNPAMLVGVAAVAGFTWIALRLRAVTMSGALAGALAALTLYTCAGPGGFACLFAVFALTWVATRIGHARKQQIGVAERRGGRDAAQVLANLAVAAFASFIATASEQPIMTVAAIAALAEAAADTVSSEYGQATSDSAYLITTFERVPVGIDGGISFAGTLAGMLASVIVAGVAEQTRVLDLRSAAVAAGAGILGMFVDSLLGAVLERRGLLGNNAVNFLSTSFAAVAALTILWR
jgi:uncharacterized protein (TIGR00297 family)